MGSNRINMVGMRFNKLTILEYAYTKNKRSYWKCKCDCGNQIISNSNAIRRGHTKSCGCARRRDLQGMKFGLLMVAKYHGLNKNKQALWECLCECGGHKIVSRTDLVCNRIKSCGCLYRKKDRLKHIYDRLFNMKKQEAGNRGLSFKIGYDLFKNLISQNCFYCGIEPNAKFEDIYHGKKMSNIYFNHNGLDRINSHKGYEIDNVAPCCTRCNYMKLTMTQQEFIDHVDKIHQHYHSLTECGIEAKETND